MRAFVTCDGEAKQIEVFQEEDMLPLLSTTLIDFGKTPASCSAICQSSDVSPFFKAAKKRLAGLHEGVLYKNDYLIRKLEEIFDGTQGITNENSKKIIDGLLQIVYTVKSTLTSQVIQDGYIETGQYPLSFERAMSKCTYTFSSSQLAEMKASLPDAVVMFQAKGELTEIDMDELGILDIYASREKKPKAKDQRVLHQQRSVLMNKEETIAKYKIYKTAKQLELDSKLAKAAERVAKRAAAVDKKAAQAEYKAWFNTLTIVEQKAERKKKRDENAAKKVVHIP